MAGKLPHLPRPPRGSRYRLLQATPAFQSWSSASSSAAAARRSVDPPDPSRLAVDLRSSLDSLAHAWLLALGDPRGSKHGIYELGSAFAESAPAMLAALWCTCFEGYRRLQWTVEEYWDEDDPPAPLPPYKDRMTDWQRIARDTIDQLDTLVAQVRLIAPIPDPIVVAERRVDEAGNDSGVVAPAPSDDKNRSP